MAGLEKLGARAVTNTTPGEYLALPEDFLKQLGTARRRVRVVACFAVMFGLLALAYMLRMALHGVTGPVTMVKLGFLGAGAVGFGIGLGLFGCSGGARSAGAVWFVAWGLLNLVVGFAAALAGDPLMGIFALVTGAIHLFFAAVIGAQDATFVCDYLGGDLAVENVRQGVRFAAAEGSPEMHLFLSGVVGLAPPGRGR